ncbi:MAG: type II secretion system protein [Bdellovibrionales bacterium]|nr:type II secretion system protein [Bdellovibrionales bacterium]
MKFYKSISGFSLLEVISALAIFSILVGVITSASVLFFNQAKITKAKLQNSLVKTQLQQALYSPYFCSESLKNINLPSEDFPEEGVTFGLKLPSRDLPINEGDSIDQIEFDKIRISRLENSFSIFNQTLSTLTINFEFKVLNQHQTYLKPYNLIIRALIDPETEQVTRCVSSLTEEEACESLGGKYYPVGSDKCVQNQTVNNEIITEQVAETMSQFKFVANCSDANRRYTLIGQFELDTTLNKINETISIKVFHELTQQLVCVKRYINGFGVGCSDLDNNFEVSSDVNGVSGRVDGVDICTGKWYPQLFGDDIVWKFNSPKLKTSCFCTYKESGGELQTLCNNLPPDADMVACQAACTAQGSGTCYYYGNDVEDFVE